MSSITLETREFNELRELILAAVGIRLSDAKRTLLEGRLASRLRRHNLDSYAGYIELVRRDAVEMVEMVNAVTTNKTSFFREAHHFRFLTELLQGRARSDGPFQVWSAGCSSGEEPYSIAMTARDAGADIRVVASDVDTNVLARATRGVYAGDQRDELSPEIVRRHFLRGRNDQDGNLRIRAEVRASVQFQQVNLIAPTWPLSGPFDAIFCRNVVIYFDRETQDRLFRRFATLLKPDGLLFLGHSESISWLGDLFEPIGQTVYRLRGGAAAGPPAFEAKRTAPHMTSRPRPMVALALNDLTGARSTRKPTVRAGDRVAAALAASDRDPSVVRVDAGDVHASRTPCEVRTVLGSCVAACLFDPVAGVGGMNHFMLPDGGQSDQPARYGAYAMELLINQIMKLGGDRARLRAKIFGAASVIRMERAAVDVGRDNIAFVRKFLATERIPIDAEKLGGTRPLDVRMDATTGRVRVRALGADTLGDLVDAERTGLQRQWQPAAPADVGDVLF